MKHFEIEGKPCRGLPFDKELQGPKRLELVKNNIFVKTKDPEVTSKVLEETFAKEFGEVKSAKLSLNSDYTPRGYGFVCF
jgi:RNA recognition motif-containing protein